ncbi:MAG: hypothetical protein Q7S09_04430 [bacterium]|nr:hypothetical protein [bacterium]
MKYLSRKFRFAPFVLLFGCLFQGYATAQDGGFSNEFGQSAQPPAAAEAPVPKPSPEEGKTAPPRRPPVLVSVLAEREVFVGDEPVKFHYVVRSLAGVRVEVDAGQDLAPFSVVSIAVGNRITLPGAEGVTAQEFTVVLRLLGNLPLGAYAVPPLAVRYEYDEIIPGADGKVTKTRKSNTALSKSVKLEKVPLYVLTDTLHEVVHIGDPNVLTLSIHASAEAEILNEHPPEKPQEGIVYLSSFSLDKPFAMLARHREEAVGDSGTYRVVAYRYTYLVLDIQSEPFKAPVPPVLWKLRKAKKGASSDIRTISPSSANVTVRSILKKDSVLEPQKGMPDTDPMERTFFFIVPATLAALLAVGLAGFGISRLITFLAARKARKRRLPVSTTAGDEELPEPVYETSFWAWLRLRYKLRNAWLEYNRAPSKDGCMVLRSLVARYAVSRIRGEGRIDRIQAASFTADEFAGILDPSWIQVLARLEHQLEGDSYTAIPIFLGSWR